MLMELYDFFLLGGAQEINRMLVTSVGSIRGCVTGWPDRPSAWRQRRWQGLLAQRWCSTTQGGGIRGAALVGNQTRVAKPSRCWIDAWITCPGRHGPPQLGSKLWRLSRRPCGSRTRKLLGSGPLAIWLLESTTSYDNRYLDVTFTFSCRITGMAFQHERRRFLL